MTRRLFMPLSLGDYHFRRTTKNNIMTYKDLRDVRGHYVTLRDLVIHQAGGWDDVNSRIRFEGLCGEAMMALDDPECHQWLRLLREQANALFSRAEHLKWGRSSMTGAGYETPFEPTRWAVSDGELTLAWNELAAGQSVRVTVDLICAKAGTTTAAREAKAFLVNQESDASTAEALKVEIGN